MGELPMLVFDCGPERTRVWRFIERWKGGALDRRYGEGDDEAQYRFVECVDLCGLRVHHGIVECCLSGVCQYRDVKRS